MNYQFHRTYRGAIKAVLFDWAGTIVDYGSRAPAGVFVEVFERHGAVITPEEARGPMGMEKRAHIAAIASLRDVQQRWERANAARISDADIDRMYDEFLPLQLECLPRYADLVPGTLESVRACRARGIRIGTSTGYARVLMDVLAPAAQHRGFEADAVVSADEVPQGRPAPWMCFEAAKRLGVWPMEAIVVVDDTIPGLEAGLNAGMWTVGVAKSGNELGLSLEQTEALDAGTLRSRLDVAYDRLSRCGAHYVIDSVADLLPVIDGIETRLRRGEKP
jgi:phosphonoacetaldehyde hydrolase